MSGENDPPTLPNLNRFFLANWQHNAQWNKICACVATCTVHVPLKLWKTLLQLFPLTLKMLILKLQKENAPNRKKHYCKNNKKKPSDISQKKSFRVIRKTVNGNTFCIYSPRDLFISRNCLSRAWYSRRHKRSCCLANLWKVERIVLKAWINITNAKSQAITSQKSLLRGHSHVWGSCLSSTAPIIRLRCLQLAITSTSAVVAIEWTMLTQTIHCHAS